MNASSPSPVDACHGDTKSRLLEAAGPVFARQGFDGATVREICAAASVNVASVAYYFGDKLGLYREVIRAIRDAREKRFPAPSDQEIDARVMMYRLVHTMLSRMLAVDSSGWESQLLMREMQQPTPVFENIVREFFRPMYDTLTSTLRNLVGEGVPDHKVDQLALSVVGQCVYYRFGAGVVQILIPEPERNAHFNIESLSRHITAVTLAATDRGAVLSHQRELEDCLAAVEFSSPAISETEH